MLSDQEIKELKDSISFQAFHKHVHDKVATLISTKELLRLQGLSNDRAGEDIKVKLKAVEIVVGIFSPIDNFFEKTPPTKEQVKEAEKSVGL